LWRPTSSSVIIAVHGDQSNKADKVIAILAEKAMKKGYQTLRFDLPEHGDRKAEPRFTDSVEQSQLCTRRGHSVHLSQC